jgi:hypothetical protein
MMDGGGSQIVFWLTGTAVESLIVAGSVGSGTPL